MMSNLTPMNEAAARKMVDERLVNLGWIIDERQPNCNVFSEGAKTIGQREALQHKRPDYVLYAPDSDRPIAIIETKRPGRSLDEAIRQADVLYAQPLDVDIIFATDGVLCQSFDRRSGEYLVLDNEPVSELLSPKLVLKFTIEGSALITPTEIRQTKRELLKVFAEANELLRKEGLREGVERFSEFANLLFLKLVSEIEAHRETRGEPRRFESKYCWDQFASLSPELMMDYINDTVLPRLVNHYNGKGVVFHRRLGIINPENLHKVVTRLSKLSLLNIESDVKGDAFEYFLKHSITVGNDLGEYFTPRHIVRLIVDLISPVYGETIYDPCCGTGGFLIQAFRHILDTVKLDETTKEVLENKTFYGCELTGTARIAKMNMILAGDGHTNIYQRDCLSTPLQNQYDVVMTNFPFSQTTDFGQLYGINTTDANPVFLRHIIDACATKGRIGVVVPEGLLFAENHPYTDTRKYLLQECELVAVISLNEYVFRPYTGQPTAILILNKGTSQRRPVWFYEVLEDGYEKTTSKKGRNPVTNGENDLVNLRSLWAEKATSSQSFTVPIETIRENAYKLSMSSYRPRIHTPTSSQWLPLGGPDGVCEILLGATPNTTNGDYWNGEHPWAVISDMRSRYITRTAKTITDAGVKASSVKLLPKGTVLVSFKLTIGKVAIAGCDLYTNEAIAGLIPKDKPPQDKILPEYLYHLLPYMNLENYIQPAAKGKTLNKQILERINIPVPSKHSQQSFIDRMNRLETKAIALRDKANELDQDIETSGRAFVDSMT